MACWRRFITQFRYSIHQAPTQVQRQQSEFGKVKHLLTRNYRNYASRKIKHQTRISNSMREEGSSISGLNATIRNAGKPTKDGFFGTESALFRMLAASKGGNFKRSPWHDAASYLCSFGLHALIWYLLIKAWSQILGVDEEVLPSMETNTKLSDLKGVDELKTELEEIVHYLKDPEHFTRLGGKVPKSILLVGPPSIHKKLLASAIAGEAGVPFFASSVYKLDGDLLIGLGAKRVRDLFAAAKKRSPCIIFIDDIDDIRRKRYINMTLNQMLVSLDGFKQNEGIIVIATADNPTLLDKAFVTPGRFDRHVDISYPDVEGRRQILEYHMSKVRKEEDVDVMIIAAQYTSGLSRDDLAKLVDVAALRAAEYGAKAVSMHDLEFARDTIKLGIVK